MKAHWTTPAGRRIEMIEITTGSMDDILSDAKRGKLSGLPYYFDSKKRIWPLPNEGEHVDFDE